jgi:hypothetical protein
MAVIAACARRPLRAACGRGRAGGTGAGGAGAGGTSRPGRSGGYDWVRLHCWLVPLPQVYCWMSAPSAVLALTTSRHLPLCRALSW